jgi:hypothetical protein
MDALTLFTRAMADWLVERTGPNEGSRLSQGVRLDVFATSMRVTKQIPGNLQRLAAGAQLIGSDVAQRITDLLPTGLVRRSPAGAVITDFGRAVLGRWEAAGVAVDSDTGELLRQVILVDEGIAGGPPVYRLARSFWEEMTRVHPAEQWFSKPSALYLVSYLNLHDSHGYNPWVIIRAANATVLEASDAQWHSWAATTPTPAGWSKTSGEKLLAAVTSAATRYVGRVNFCMALEARRRATSGQDLAAIVDWRVPYA